MKTQYLLLLLMFLTGCSDYNGKKNKNEITHTPKQDSTTNSEFLEWNSTKINGIIPMISRFENAVKLLGKPDSIAELTEGVNGSYFNRKFQYCYFKALKFEKYNDTLIFSGIDFSKPTSFYLTDGRISFDKSTTESNFKKYFPDAFESNQLHGTSMDIYEYIFLATSHRLTDDEWGFTFFRKNGKLWVISHDNSR